MEPLVKNKLSYNSLIFKRSLDQIIEKYSKLQHKDGAIEVDLNNTKDDSIKRYINRSIKELSKLQSKNLTHLSEESLSAQDITGDSQLDITHKDEGGDETCGSYNQFARKDNEASLSLLDGSLRSFSEEEFQPEDQDEDLQMSLSSNGSSLVELYPSMVSRLERAWHQQYVSVAADSVLRRYRRWRQQSKRRDFNSTFDVTLKRTNGDPKRPTRKESTDSRIKRQLVRTETTPEEMTSPHAEQQSNMEKDFLRRQQSTHVCVVDFSENHEPKESLLNETFTVLELSPSKLPQPGERVSMYTAYPTQALTATAEASVETSFRLKRLSDSSHSSQHATCSTYETETPAVKERSDFLDSPRRQSPFKSRLAASLSRSPHVFSRSPKKYFLDRCSQEPTRPRPPSWSLSSCPERPVVQLKLLRPQDSVQPSQPQPRSPRSARAADGRHRLRRHLSFDSALSSNPASYSPKKVDEDFMKLYHKFACQNKSAFFIGPPCRLCARTSETSRGHASSALAALDLSPHRSVLRKRYRELERDGHSQSKRFREEHCASSPGSKRHRREMMMRRLSLYELELPHGGSLSISPSKHGGSLSHSPSKHGGSLSHSPSKHGGSLSHSPSKHGGSLSHSPSKHRVQRQEAWMNQHRPASDAQFSGLCKRIVQNY